MERLLITKNGVAYSATEAAGTANSLTLASDLENLKEGSIVGFEKNLTRVTAAGSFSKTDTKGYFALGMPAGVDTRVSPLINWSTLSYSKNLYKVAVAARQVLAADGLAALTAGAFTAAMVGNQYTVTVASTAGDFREGTTALLKDVSTGLDIAADTDLTLNQVVEIVAAGTPDAWGGATLTGNGSGSALTVGTKVVGAEYGVTIVDLEKDEYERRSWDVTLTLTSASTTDAQMLANLVAAINAHVKASLVVTAAVATGDVGINFTGVTAGADFAILPQGLLYGNTITKDGTGFSVIPTKAEGSNAQIVELERKTNSVEGKTSTTQTRPAMGEVWLVPSLVESGQNYTVYVLEWTDQRDVAYVSNASHPSHKRINIAIPSGDSTAITAMDNILADLTA